MLTRRAFLVVVLLFCLAGLRSTTFAQPATEVPKSQGFSTLHPGVPQEQQQCIVSSPPEAGPEPTVTANRAIQDPSDWQHPARDTPRPQRGHRHDSGDEEEDRGRKDEDRHHEEKKDLSLHRIFNLGDDGILAQGVWVVDTSTVLSGGVNTSAWANRNLMELALGFDPGKIIHRDWKGGHLGLVFQNFRGEDGSQDTGDQIKYDNIDNAFPITQIAELYFEQLFFEGKLRVKVGKVDANTEYNITNYSLNFINSAGGNHPTLFEVMPTYPSPSTSMNFFLEATEHLHVSFGVFDGRLPEGVKTGRKGFHFGGPFWFIGETHVHFGDKQPGRIGVGAWHHTFNRFERLDGTGTEHGQSGFYLHYDQVLWFEDATSAHVHSGHQPAPLHFHLTGGPWHEADEQGVFAFFSYGIGEESVNPLPQAATIGLIWVGMIEGRDDDTLGAKVVWAELSDEAPAFLSDAETNVEVFYRCAIAPNLTLQPDLTYINNPGNAATVEQAWVFTLRAILEF